MMSSERGLAHRKVSMNVSRHYKQRRLAYFNNGLLPLHRAVSSASACLVNGAQNSANGCVVHVSLTQMLTLITLHPSYVP